MNSMTTLPSTLPDFGGTSNLIKDDGTSAEGSVVDTPLQLLGGSSSPSPRECVLSNIDLLSLILRELVPIPSNGSEKILRKDVLSTSLVCKAFHGPSLDCIWETLHTLVHLFQLLPRFKNHDGSWYFYGDIRSQEGSHFKDIARRVRFLTISSSSDPALNSNLISPFTLARLSMQVSEGTGLLPNLQRVYFEGASHLATSLVLFVAPRTLRSLRFSAGGPDNMGLRHLAEMALTYISRTGLLRELSFSDGDYDSRISSSPWWMDIPASSSRDLTRLHLTLKYALTSRELASLLDRMPQLISLRLESTTSITPERAEVESWTLTTQCSAAAGQLHELAVAVPFGRTITEADIHKGIGYLPVSSSLQVFVPNYAARPSQISWITPFIASLQTFQRLHTLVLGGNWETFEGIQMEWSTNDIRPIFNISTLRHFTLNAMVLRAAEDADPVFSAAGISGSTAKLQKLALPMTCVLIDITGIAELTHSIGLKEIKYGFDSTSLTTDVWNTIASSSRPSPLEKLCVFDNRFSPFSPQEYSTIAENLVKAFPNLREVRPYRNMAIGVHTGLVNAGRFDEWEHIGDLVQRLVLK